MSQYSLAGFFVRAGLKTVHISREIFLEIGVSALDSLRLCTLLVLH